MDIVASRVHWCGVGNYHGHGLQYVFQPQRLPNSSFAHRKFIGSVFLFIRSAAPTAAALGATNGLSQTMASFMRTIGPACATSLYALSQEHQLLDGSLVYVVLVLIAAVTLSTSFLLPQM